MSETLSADASDVMFDVNICLKRLYDSAFLIIRSEKFHLYLELILTF